MVSKGNHPQMAELFRLSARGAWAGGNGRGVAELFRLVKYENLPRYMYL